MNTRLFSIGDIVALKLHPYFNELTDIIISGDHVMIPPMMVVVELFKTKQSILANTGPAETVKYKCTWFSPKSCRFKDALILEIDLKLIKKNDVSVSKSALKRGNKVTLRSAGYELAKKKSSLTYEDSSVNTGNGNTIINSLLSYLPPVMLVLDVQAYVSKAPLTEKASGDTIRMVSSWEIKCSFFDPLAEKNSEVTLPLEALALIEEINESILNEVEQTIFDSKYLVITSDKESCLVKPRNIACREGNYYVRAYDFILNKIVEFAISNTNKFLVLDSPFTTQVPTFDIAHKPESATPEFIIQELIKAVSEAEKRAAYIRIKYKNRNDQLSHRTLKDYKMINVNENGKEVFYLVGYCLLRQAERNFRVDRIQNLQGLKLSFTSITN